MCPITIPTNTPNPYPINTSFQEKPSKYSNLLSRSELVLPMLPSHLFDNGDPHNPGFSSKGELRNVSNNYLPCGMRPLRLFSNMLKYASNVKLVSCWEILTWGMFLERSNGSSSVEMRSMKLLLDKLSTTSIEDRLLYLEFLHGICYLKDQWMWKWLRSWPMSSLFPCSSQPPSQHRNRTYVPYNAIVTHCH